MLAILRIGGGGAETLEKEGRKFAGDIRWKNSLRNSCNSPKFAKLRDSPQIRSAEPRVQDTIRNAGISKLIPLDFFDVSFVPKLL